MCINENISLIIFLVCSITCIYLFKRNYINDRWIAIAFFYIGLMQILEFIMWVDQECKGPNQIATDIAFWQTILWCTWCDRNSIVFDDQCIGFCCLCFHIQMQEDRLKGQLRNVGRASQNILQILALEQIQIVWSSTLTTHPNSTQIKMFRT